MEISDPTLELHKIPVRNGIELIKQMNVCLNEKIAPADARELFAPHFDTDEQIETAIDFYARFYNALDSL